MRKKKITIVGPGRLGAALAGALKNAGYAIDEIVCRERPESLRRGRQIARKLGAKLATLKTANFDAEVIWICVGDDAIRGCAESIAERGSTRFSKKFAFHASGARTSDELDGLRKAGGRVASVHPMMSFVYASRPSLAGVTFGLEGDAAALRVARGVVRDLKGETISIAKQDKPLYHAWGGFASPLIIAELAAADLIAQRLGISPAKARKTLAPILRQTIENYIAHGAAAAFSGPIVRGDLGTVRGHLEALKQVPKALEVYRALVTTAVEQLPAANRAEMEKLLARKNG